MAKYQRQEKHRKCSSFNSSASEVTTDQGAILRKHNSICLTGQVSLLAPTSKSLSLSWPFPPCKAAGWGLRAAQLLPAGSATAFSRQLLLSLLLLPPCIGDSKAPEASQPFSFQHRSTHQSIFQQSAQSKQICPRCLVVLLLVPSLPPLKGFPGSPNELWNKTDLEIMGLPPKFGSTATRYVSHNTPPQQSSAAKHSTNTELQILPGGFRICSWKALSQCQQKASETKRRARMLAESQVRIKGEGKESCYPTNQGDRETAVLLTPVADLNPLHHPKPSKSTENCL